MYQRKVGVDMLNVVKSMLVDVRALALRQSKWYGFIPQCIAVHSLRTKSDLSEGLRELFLRKLFGGPGKDNQQANEADWVDKSRGTIRCWFAQCRGSMQPLDLCYGKAALLMLKICPVTRPWTRTHTRIHIYIYSLNFDQTHGKDKPSLVNAPIFRVTDQSTVKCHHFENLIFCKVLYGERARLARSAHIPYKTL